MEVTGEQVLRKVQADDRFAVTMLIKLYERQTEDERQVGETVHRNSAGFNALDADFLSSLAQQAINRRAQRKAGEIPAHWTDLSPKQMACLRKKLPKYVRQMVDITNARFAEKANEPEVLTGVAAAEELVTRMAANGASIAECFAVAAAVLGKSGDQPSPAIVEQINEPAERPYVEPSCRLIENGCDLRFPTAKEIQCDWKVLLSAEAERRNAEATVEFERLFS